MAPRTASARPMHARRSLLEREPRRGHGRTVGDDGRVIVRPGRVDGDGRSARPRTTPRRGPRRRRSPRSWSGRSGRAAASPAAGRCNAEPSASWVTDRAAGRGRDRSGQALGHVEDRAPARRSSGPLPRPTPAAHRGAVTTGSPPCRAAAGVRSAGVEHEMEEDVDHDPALRVGHEVDLPTGMRTGERTQLVAGAGTPGRRGLPTCPTRRTRPAPAA